MDGPGKTSLAERDPGGEPVVVRDGEDAFGRLYHRGAYEAHEGGNPEVLRWANAPLAKEQRPRHSAHVAKPRSYRDFVAAIKEGRGRH
jgi:hypothetical protein